jgi:hypothetical protein
MVRSNVASEGESSMRRKYFVSAGAIAAKTYTPPRTPWGHPDIQGTYTTHEGNYALRNMLTAAAAEASGR